jgi:tight adherence protein B
MNSLWAMAASAACAGGCAYVVVAAHPRKLLLGRGIGTTPALGARRRSIPAVGARSSVLWGAIAMATAVIAAQRTGSLVLATLLLVAVAVLARTRRARLRQRALERRRVAVIDLCAALAAELRAGVPSPDALERTAQVPASAEVVVPRAFAAARSGGDVAQGLRWDAAAPGAEGLRGVAACWDVAMGSGAAMSPALSLLVRGLRAEQAHRREVAATLAAPRATARLLALLPGAGLLMGTGLGVDPMGLLLGTPIGAALLMTGGGLALLGVIWTERLARVPDPGRSRAHEEVPR